MKCPWLAVSPVVWMAANASASHNTHTVPAETYYIEIDLSINSCGSFIKCTVQTLNAQLSETTREYILSNSCGEFNLIYWYTSWGPVNNYGRGWLKCSVMVTSFTEPSWMHIKSIWPSSRIHENVWQPPPNCLPFSLLESVPA